MLGGMEMNTGMRRRSRLTGAGTGIADAIAAAAQMAFLHPSGTDEWMWRALAGDGRDARDTGTPDHRPKVAGASRRR